MLRGSGGTWKAQASNVPQALSSITCLDASQCFAGGALGTVVTTTDDGATWTQQGNPLSGPTTALNAGPTGLTQINAAACNSGRCAFGTASSGNVMTSPLVRVTVQQVTPYGQAPFPVTNPSITVSPASEAANVTGTLTCQTTATDHSVAGVYPVSDCTGLSDPGSSVVYDYANSTDTVVFPTATGTVTGTVPPTLSLTLGAPATFAPFIAGVAQDYTASTTANVISTAGDATLSISDPSSQAPGHLVNGTFSLASALQAYAARAGGLAAYQSLGASPVALLTYNVPVSNDPLTLGFKQSIGANEPLRTGSYAKTLTFTLSTTTP
jgi:hypothetical protein